MELDILDSLQWQEEDLSQSAISFVRDAQEEKDKLTRQLQKDKREAYYKLLKNGTLRSSMLESIYAALDEEYNAKIALLKDNLAFKIKFLGDNAQGGEDADGYNYPYHPDYSLDYAGRYYAVYNYYMSMTDANVRFALFQADTLAPDYLGDFYATLYERLRSYAEIT